MPKIADSFKLLAWKTIDWGKKALTETNSSAACQKVNINYSLIVWWCPSTGRQQTTAWVVFWFLLVR